jgi:phosphoribosylformylglycinamidine synthase
MIKAKICIKLKPNVFNSQSKAVYNALQAMGYDNVVDIETSKFYDLTFDETDVEVVKKQLVEICGKVLSNPSIGTYAYE